MPLTCIPRHILIVEDDRDFSRSLADILELHEYTVQVAANLDEARTLLAAEFFPLVLCDMRLGNERGLDLLDHIRQQQLACRYLVLTAYADTQMAIEALQLGAADFLRKPLEVHQLLASLKRNFEVLDLEKDRQDAQEAQLKHEQELALSEERFRALFDTSPDAIILSDLESGALVDVNRAVVLQIGVAKEELLGKNSLEIGLWEEQARQQFYEVLREQGQVENMEAVYRRPKSREEVHGLLSARITQIQGRDYLLTVVRDISELKKIEREREQERRLTEAIIDSLPGLFFMFGKDGLIHRWNQNYYDDLGYAETDRHNLNALDLIPPEEHPKARERIEEVFRSGRATLEASQITKRGDKRPYYFSGKRLDRGEESYVVGVGFDISDRLAAEQALRESEERYRQLYREFETLLNGIPDALVLLNPEQTIVWANHGAESHFGPEVGTLPGKHCQDLWGREEELCDDCIQKTFEEGVAQEKIHHSGDGRVWGMKVFPIKGADGQVVNVLQLSSDLTEKITLREEAARASRLAALGEMAAGVAHEINNPNGMIQINLGMVAQALEEGREVMDRHYEQQGDFPWGGINYSRMRDEIPRLVTEMRDASQRIKRTVEELKGFSRRDLTSDFTPLEVNASVEAALRLCADDIQRAGAQVAVKLQDGLPRVRGLAQRIEQILVNLISNACHALTGEGRNVEIVTRQSSGGGQVEVRVQDHGCGIAPEHLERLTDPFFTTRRETGGTGLGLSLSARMAKEHGGRLEFKSTPGEGTTVTLILPVDQGGNA